jgi:hypothetical protein
MVRTYIAYYKYFTMLFRLFTFIHPRVCNMKKANNRLNNVGIPFGPLIISRPDPNDFLDSSFSFLISTLSDAKNPPGTVAHDFRR